MRAVYSMTPLNGMRRSLMLIQNVPVSGRLSRNRSRRHFVLGEASLRDLQVEWLIRRCNVRNYRASMAPVCI